MKHFYYLLGNGLIVAIKNNFVWFALTFWIYLQTQSVLSTSLIGGIYLATTALSSIWLGSIVDHHKKKQVMMGANIVTLILFSLGLFIYQLAPASALSTVASPLIWLFALLLLSGVIAGSVYNIAIPTLVTLMVSEKKRDKANGMLGTVMGISFSVTSFASGVALAYAGMAWVLVAAIILTIVALVHLQTIPIDEEKIVRTVEEKSKKMDVAGTIQAIKDIPGLFALIFFTTFNNFLGGVFMALMDAYGLSLLSVQMWGFLWGFVSLGFILGGLYIAKRGLGKNPLRILFRVNIIIWLVCMFFTIQPSIILLTVGIFIWITLVPFIEATEQTIIQKVVPHKRQGRVFGFAHSVEQAASPLTAFLIGPIAQYVFIPFMTDGVGAQTIGSWYGVGTGRGIALVFTMTGVIGLTVTLIAMRSRSYKLLSERYAG